MEDLKVLNSEKASIITGGDKDLFCQLLEIFHDTSPLQVERIKKALVDNDKDELIASAHDIKSSASSIGADNLFHIAFELEKSARENSDSKAIVLINDIEKQLQAIDEQYRSLSWKADFKEEL